MTDSGHLGPIDFSNPQQYLQMNWLVEGWFERGDVVMWAGDPGIGKSVACLAAGISLAAGRPMLGLWPHPTGQPFRVAILDLENPKSIIVRRLIRLGMGLSLDLSTIYPRHLDAYPLRGVGLFGQANSQEILDSLTVFSPDLVILDTVMSATNQDTLSPLAGVRFVRDNVMRWAECLKCGWWLIHHTRKPTDNSPGSKDARIGDLHQASGGGFVGMADALVLVQKDDRNRIVLTNPKQRHQANEGRYYLRMIGGEDPVGPLSIQLSPTHLPSGRSGDLFLKILPLLPMESPDLARLLCTLADIKPRQARAYITQWVHDGCLSRQPVIRSTGGRARTLLAVAPK